MKLKTLIIVSIAVALIIPALALLRHRIPSFLSGQRRAAVVRGGTARGNVNGRTYEVHVPRAYKVSTPTPVVIALHGGGGNAQSMAEMSGLNEKSDQEGFIVVYPDGTKRAGVGLATWNAGDCCGVAAEEKVDDVKFIRSLIEKLEGEYTLDRRRIYATGMSNGGMLTHRLGCELADKLAAIAPVSAALVVDNCRPSQPVSVIAFHGTADENVPYNGGRATKRTALTDTDFPSVQETIGAWVSNNGCARSPRWQKRGIVTHELYTGCRSQTEVELYTITEGDHVWPGGGRDRIPGDRPTNDISATDTIWDFFKRHSR